MEEGTAEAAEVSTAAVEADFMEAVGFTAAEASPVEAALVSSAAIRLAGIVAVVMEAEDIEAATTVVEATTAAVAATVAAAATVGAAGVTAGAAEAGDGDLATAGRIGDMAGAIRTATTATARGITRPTLIIRTRPMGLRTT
jgi:hypothetical protein